MELQALVLPGEGAGVPLSPRSASPERGDLLVLGPRGEDADPEFVDAARRLCQQDPRIASVSAADPTIASLAESDSAASIDSRPRLEPTTLLASGLSGRFVVLQPAVFDLTEPPLGGVGPPDPAQVLAWASHANGRGLRHVWRWSGASSSGTAVWPTPTLEQAEAKDPCSPVGAMVDRYRSQHLALRLAVDASWMTDRPSGAQTAVVNWLDALAARDDVSEIQLHRLPGRDLPGYAGHLSRRSAIRILDGQEAGPPVDVFWRPNQPDDRADADRDRALGRRVVVTVLDLIEHSNAAYQVSTDVWRARRAALRRYLGQVDLVAGISHDVRSHLLAEIPGLSTDRLVVTPLGVDHMPTHVEGPPPPDLIAQWAGVHGSRYVLVLGNDYLHKNRDFAIRVWQALPDELAADLVLAGHHVSLGSTTREEQALLSTWGKGSRRSVVHLPHLSAGARNWLMANAAAVLYPTSAEGFGLVPHEAAQLGVPSLFTPFGPLREGAPAAGGPLGWSARDYGTHLAAWLRDASESDRAATSVRTGYSVTWEESSTALGDAFRRALAMPPASAARAARTLPLDPSDPILASVADPEVLLSVIVSSRSWRLTRPLRRAAAFADRARASRRR